MVPVAWKTDYVGWMPSGLKEPCQHVDRGEDLKGAVDRCSPQSRVCVAQLRDDLLCRERARPFEYGVEDSRARTRHPVPMLRENLANAGRREGRRRL